MQADDYIVAFKREDTLADAALAWRREAKNENYSHFNIVTFVEKVLLPKSKRPFTIEFFDARDGQKPAFVSFTPEVVLNVDRAIWDLARDGEPDARFIVAHEIGHLTLHDHFAKAFSDDPSDHVKSVVKERSAEWQANTFAFYFLMPDMIVAAYRDVTELSVACEVTERIARLRVAMNSRLALLYSASQGGFCPNCGEFCNTGEKCRNPSCVIPMAVAR